MEYDDKSSPEDDESKSESSETKPSSNAGRKTTPLWYYLTFFVWPIGGLIAFFALRTKDPRKAKKCLIITLIILLILVSMWIGFRVAFGTENPFYVVSTGSMIPNLNIFDVIVTQGNIPFENIQVGDIIVFNRPNGQDKVIVHRVVEILNKDPLTLRTKGDSNPGSIPGTDFPITKEDYIGKVIYVTPQIGYVTRILTPPINYIILAVIVGIAYAHHSSYRKEITIE